MSFVVCVTGGQLFKDKEMVFMLLDEMIKSLDITELWHGDCPTGADKFADDWANENGIRVRKFPAAWNIYGRGAGFVRNKVMAESGPDVLVAFPGANGTKNMMAEAKAHGIPIVEAKGWQGEFQEKH